MTRDASTKVKGPITLVLGPHRSGSSITTKLLQSLGCELGNDLVGAESSNPMGHFENLKVHTFHEGLLQRANTDWKNPAPLRNNKFIQDNRGQIEQDLKSLLDELVLDEKITALKEPRISILLDLWKPALKEYNGLVKVVLTIRHPSEVAASLARRDGLNIISGLHLWTKAMLNGIGYARDVPNFFLFYSQLVDRPENVATDLAKFMGLADLTSSDVSVGLSDIRSNYRHFDFLNEGGSPSRLASEIFEYLTRFKRASVGDFPDSLLDDWDAQLQANLRDLDREELIKLDGQQRDELTQQRDELTQQRDELIQQRDELIQQRDAIVNSTIWRSTRIFRQVIELLKG